MTLRLVVVLAVVFAGLDSPSSQRPRDRVKLRPVDEAVQVPKFKAYRDALQAAVAARDADRVLPMMHPEIGQGGLEMALRSTRDQLGGQEHEAWTKLEELLRLGGTFSKGLHRVRDKGQRQYATREFCAPYVWSAYPPTLPEPLEGMVEPWVILGSRVAVRVKPPRDMRVLTRLDYDLVHLIDPFDRDASPSQEWIGVKLPDGRRGYVARSFIRNPDDYHACFGEFEGQWLMTEFARR